MPRFCCTFDITDHAPECTQRQQSGKRFELEIRGLGTYWLKDWAEVIEALGIIAQNVPPEEEPPTPKGKIN